MTFKHIGKFFIMIFFDFLMLMLSILVGFYLFLYINPTYDIYKIYDYYPLIMFSPIIHYLFGLYKNVCYSIINDSKKLILSILTNFSFFATFMFLSKDGIEFSRLVFTFSLITSIIIFPFYRYYLRLILGRINSFRSNVIIFGSGKMASKIYKDLNLNRHIGLRPILFFDNDIKESTHIDNIPIVNNMMSANEYIEKYKARFGILAVPSMSIQEQQKIIDFYADRFIQFIIIPDFFSIPSLWVDSIDFFGQLGFQIRHKLIIRRYIVLKRIFDFIVSFIGGICIFPLLAIIMIFIKLSSKGPIIYSQKRIGQNGQKFNAYKFRSMIQNADKVLKHFLKNNELQRLEWERTQKLKNDPRITWIGNILRKTSLDELPQLINVIKGEMSLVGPRPIVDDEIQKYDSNYNLYKRVKPGMTGLWQVSGRNNTTYKERIEFDCYYVRNWSLSLDLYILFRTVKVVLFREGAY